MEYEKKNQYRSSILGGKDFLESVQVTCHFVKEEPSEAIFLVT